MSSVVIAGDTSGTITLAAPAVSGTTVLTLPTTNGTLVTTGTTTGISGSAISTGTVATTVGGTGLTSFTSGGAMYATSTSALTTGTLPIASGGTGTTSTTFVNAATNVTGTLPVANGGTGTATPSLVGGTNITISGSWPNQTVTASGGGVTSLNGQTGAITNTDLYAIGSYITGRPQNATNYVVNNTIAGSSLYSAPPGNRWNNSTSAWVNPSGNAPGYQDLTNTGTWRCTSAAVGWTATQNFCGVWVRIS
jgi:hypothetical protein